jgi:drug/metabolite transporter (DMT)-like permease
LNAPTQRSGRAAATLAGAAAIVLWASETVLITLTGHVPPLQIVALAFTVAALPSPLIWWATGTDPLVAFRQPAGVWLLTIASLLGYHAFLYHAVQKAPAAPAALLQGCTPLLIVVGSALLPGERLRWWHLIGAMAGLGGVWVLVAGQTEPVRADTAPTFYLAVVGMAAALWGVYSLLTRTLSEVPTSAMGVFYAGTAVAAGIGHRLFESWITPSPEQWAAIVTLGLLPIGSALYLWDHGIKRGDLQALGVFSYVEPFLGVVLVVILGRGDFGWSLIGAGVLIVGGATLAARSAWV